MNPQKKHSTNKKPKAIVAIAIVLILIILQALINNTKTEHNTPKDENILFSKEIPLHITKHAKERMQCRLIDTVEIREILLNGQINNKKSDISTSPCKTKYAVEGRSNKDQQLIRVIAAPCDDKINIVTVIDLENEYDCE